MSNENFIMGSTIVGGRVKRNQFRLIRRLGSGSFGDVYEAMCVETGESYAVKMQSKCLRGANLPKEHDVYKKLLGSMRRTREGVVGVPNIRWWGEYQKWFVLVMDLLGPSLLEQYEKCRRQFSMKTTCMLAIDMIDRIESLHKSGFVHCDIKPENFAMGRKGVNEDMVHMFDLGLAFRWRMPGTGKHVALKQDKTGMTGTCRYASIWAHLGFEHARRNDMESLAYVLLFLYHGGLPWQGYIERSDGARRRKVCAKKQSTTMEELCRNCPPEFATYVKYVRSLPFEKQPDYAYCRGLFEKIMNNKNYVNDKQYDWKLLHIVNNSHKRAFDGGNIAQDTKKQRLGSIGVVQQYMVVTTLNDQAGMRQQWTSSTSYASMVSWIEGNWKDPMWRITSVCVSGSAWITVLSYNTPHREQSIKQSRWFLADEWITKKWNQGFWITCMSGRSGINGCTVIVMSTNCMFDDQIYHTSGDFPSEWVKEQWGNGYFITSIATRDEKWAVVMSKGSNLNQQCYEVDSAYPSKRIHERWRQGYYITAVGATTRQVAYVMSKEKGQKQKTVVPQCSHRSTHWPRERIYDDWQKKQFVMAVAYGRTM